MRCLWCHANLKMGVNWSVLFSKEKVRHRILCDRCQKQLSPIDPSLSCPGCSRIQTSNNYCPDCLQWKEQYIDEWVHHRAIFQYNEFGREYMKRFKYQGDTQLAAIMSAFLKETFLNFQNDWVITPIPSSQKSLDERGFNQIECFLQMADLPYKILLENVSRDKKQAEKTRRERLATAQKFHLKEDKKDWIKEQKIIIFDDVYTTGRTIFHAKEALYDAKSLKSISIFR